MIALKALIGFKGDKEKLIMTAVEQLEVSLPEDTTTKCLSCNTRGTFFATKDDVVFKTGALVKNTPVWKCKNCGETLYDLKLLAEIEKVIQEEVTDFQDLLKSH